MPSSVDCLAEEDPVFFLIDRIAEFGVPSRSIVPAGYAGGGSHHAIGAAADDPKGGQVSGDREPGAVSATTRHAA